MVVAVPGVIVLQAAFGVTEVCCKHAMGAARAALGLELSLSQACQPSAATPASGNR